MYINYEHFNSKTTKLRHIYLCYIILFFSWEQQDIQEFYQSSKMEEQVGKGTTQRPKLSHLGRTRTDVFVRPASYLLKHNTTYKLYITAIE